MDLEKLIELSHNAAKPYKWVAILLTALLCVSVACNIYLATREMQVTIHAENNDSYDSVIEQHKG
ncbi:MAG: hypothetical protein IJ184_03155 [Alphaproteobacteria bacterium]|nr:hypothetical protein [Alphaproteobacteria bacterium]